MQGVRISCSSWSNYYKKAKTINDNNTKRVLISKAEAAQNRNRVFRVEVDERPVLNSRQTRSHRLAA